MENNPIRVYARTDENGRIIAVNSSVFLRDTEGWTLIDEGTGERFMHAQGNYFPGSLLNERGIFRFKLLDGAIIERPDSELDADLAKIMENVKPAISDRLEILEKFIEKICKLMGVSLHD